MFCLDYVVVVLWLWLSCGWVLSWLCCVFGCVEVEWFCDISVAVFCCIWVVLCVCCGFVALWLSCVLVSL